MSWPSDGAPRFKVTMLRGGTIGYVPSSRMDRLNGSVDFYVLDRANCHRVVRTITVPPWREAVAAGREASDRMAARLNDA